MTAAEKLVLSGGDVFPVAADFLNRGQKVIFTVSGNSMWPLIRHNRDSVLLSALDRPARAGDIVLMKVPAPHNLYILHRIHRIREDYCVTLGDGCLKPDPPVPLTCIIGRVEKVYRGKRTIDCDSLPSRFLFWLWRAFLPVRRPLLHGFRMAGRVMARLRRR
jgi:hypothetical protein